MAVKASREFQIFAKPIGAICNLDCHYCYYSILKFFQVDSTGMFRMTSSARYFKKGVGSSRPN